MAVVISMLRGVNVGGHNKIKMEALRALYESLGLRGAQTFIQSGNVIFQTQERDLAKLSKRIEDAIEKKFGFRPSVVNRTSAELRDAIARNPFAPRRGIEPGKLAFVFLTGTPNPDARDKALKLDAPEELRIEGKQAYIYYVNGMARPKLSWPAVERILQVSGTARNLNSVTKMLALAEAMEQ